MAKAIPALKMLWLTMMILAGFAVLVAGGEMNTTSSSSATPKVQMSMTTTTNPLPITTTTTPSPQFAAVMDIFQAPLAAFKPQMQDKTELTVGRDQQNSAGTPVPSNIFFKAGSNLGSAASSLTGWFNNRMIPQVLRPSSTTPAPPEIMFEIVPNQQVKRRIVMASDKRRKPLRNRPRPVVDDPEDLEDGEEQFNNDEDEEDDMNSNYTYDIKEDDDDEEDDYEPVEKRKTTKKSQKRPNQQYFYIEEEIMDNDDDDLDSDMEIQMPQRKPQRKQQNLTNRRRKTPPQKKKQQQQKRRKPLKKVQNPQMVQVVQNRPYQTQVKRKRRPSTTFELIPISQNQAINTIQKKKPSSSAENYQQRPVSQFLNIPWSSLGLAGPPKDPSSNEQQSNKPIIVRIPQQNIKRRKRPSKKQTANAVKNPRRKPLRGQLQNQSPVFSILSEDEVREIFKTQLNEPQQMPPQTSHSPMTLDTKKNPPKKEIEEMSSNNNNNNNDDTEEQDKPQAGSEAADNEDDTNNSFIVVGPADDDDDKEIDTNLYRHYRNYRGFKMGRAETRSSLYREADHDYDYES